MMRVLLLSLGVLAFAGELPTFEEFKVTEKFTGKPADPILRTRAHQQFRTAIREGVEKGPNFAGHFTVAEWGCGAGCVSLAIVDSPTGRILDAPFVTLVYDLAKIYEGGQDQLEYHLDSRLLIARGCPGEKACGTYYYEWVDNRFKLLHKSPAMTRRP